MKLKFKHQKFQADAATAVCDVFAGQPNIKSTYILDKGSLNILDKNTGDKAEILAMDGFTDTTGFNNKRVLISDDVIKNWNYPDISDTIKRPFH